MHFGYVLSLTTVQILIFLEYIASKVNGLKRKTDAIILRTTIAVSALYVFCLGFIALAPHLNWGFGNGLYFSIITFTTVGLGDYAPHFKGTGTLLARILLIFTLSFALIIGLSLFASIIGAVGNIVAQMTGGTETETSTPFDDVDDGGDGENGGMRSVENPMETIRLSTLSLSSRSERRSSTAEIKTDDELKIKDVENPMTLGRSSTSSVGSRSKGGRRSSTSAETNTGKETVMKDMENPMKSGRLSSKFALPSRSKNGRRSSTAETKTGKDTVMKNVKTPMKSNQFAVWYRSCDSRKNTATCR